MFQDLIQSYGVYWMFAVVCAVGFFFVAFFIYETKGKSLQEITEMFGAPRLETEDEDDDDFDNSDEFTRPLISKKEKHKPTYEAI